MKTTQTAFESANEIRVVRVYDAPVSLVWDAWTDPDQVVKWWGPRGFSLTTHSKDLRPGGKWVYTMHGPDGVDFPNYTHYHEVVPNSRLVYDHGASSEDAKPKFRVTADFREIDGKTQLDMRMTFATEEETNQSRVFVKMANGYSTWDRLAEYLEREKAQKDIFVISRSFDAPIETMYDMWTTAEHFVKWLPPTGFTMKFLRADIRRGGHGFYAMTNGTFTMFGRLDYLELHRPNRIVYTQIITDENENISRHPGAPDMPARMLTTVSLSEEGPERTRVNVRWDVDGDATESEIAVFAGMRDGMTKGWTGSFDKLDALLSEEVATT